MADSGALLARNSYSARFCPAPDNPRLTCRKLGLYQRSSQLSRRSVERGAAAQEEPAGPKAPALVELVLKAVALAMGVGVTALTIMDEVEPRNALGLLGSGVACLALVQLAHHDPEQG